MKPTYHLHKNKQHLRHPLLWMFALLIPLISTSVAPSSYHQTNVSTSSVSTLITPKPNEVTLSEEKKEPQHLYQWFSNHRKYIIGSVAIFMAGLLTIPPLIFIGCIIAFACLGPMVLGYE
ncbi:MAG: hypothetical protein ACPGC9_01510 [Cytophagales bacterium]